jgi:hypothetical protein
VLFVTEHDRGFTQSRFQEHRAACIEASSENLLIVPGIEYSDSQNLVHILTLGLDSFLGEGLPTLEILKKVRAENGVAVLAHPARREAWTQYDSSWSPYLTGIELWNRKADGWAPSLAGATLLNGTKLVPFASLDFHQRNQMFPLSMQLEISGPISEKTIVDCLRSRSCRAMAFSEPAEKFLAGWRGFTLRRAEKMRRSAAPFYRWLKRVKKSDR